MAYQFVHVETYSEQAKSVKGSKDHYNSAAQVIGEAAREPQYSTHVDMPLPPKQFFGTLTLGDFKEKYLELRATLKESVTRKNGTIYNRKLRRDAATIYTEIHSYPLKSSLFLAHSDIHFEEVGEWMQRIRSDFKNRMPDGVDYTSVLHLDEAYVHIHILVIYTADPKLDANKLHIGKVAAAKFREAHASDAVVPLAKPDLVPRPKKPKKTRLSKNAITRGRNDLAYANAIAAWEAEYNRINADNADLTENWKRSNALHVLQARIARGKPQVHKVYAAAMRTFQNEYYEAVGKPSGLLRDGPRQARRSTKEHAADKKQAKRMADEIDLLKHQRETLVRTAKALKVRTQSLILREADLAEAVDTMELVIEAVETGSSAVVDGKLHLPRLSPFLNRLSQPASLETPPLPAVMLVRRFIRLVVRHHDDGLGGRSTGLERVEEGPRS